jgi:hypothetical protein
VKIPWGTKINITLSEQELELLSKLQSIDRPVESFSKKIGKKVIASITLEDFDYFLENLSYESHQCEDEETIDKIDALYDKFAEIEDQYEYDDDD